MLFPVENVPLSSLYYAVAKRQPNGWDKYAQLIWKWKDDLPKKRRAFYAKYFKGRGSFLSLKFLPHFLARTRPARDSRTSSHLQNGNASRQQTLQESHA